MSDPSPSHPHDPTPSFPLVPFLVWSAAVLAYPACLLVALCGDAGRLEATVYALPTLVIEGLLRLPLALLAVALWAVAAGAGMALLRRAGYAGMSLAERAVFGGALGMGAFSLLTFLLGSLSGQPPWLMPALCWGLVAALGGLGARDLWGALAGGTQALNAWRKRASLLSILMAALGAALVLLALTRANVPVFADYDSLEYHLAAPAQWWRAGKVTFLRDMVYANFPQNTEMLFLLAMNCVGGPRLGAVVGLQVLIGFVVLAAGAVAACGRRLDSPAAGNAGAALLLTAPLLAELATLNSYVVELPLTAYGFLALYAYLLWRQAATAGERWRYAALCGAMAGLAIGCKYPAVLFVLAPIALFMLGGGVVQPRTLGRAAAAAALVSAAAVAVASPWFIRNAVNTGNPTYPLLYSVFGSSNWSAEQDAKFGVHHRASDLRFFSLARRVWSYALWRDQPREGGRVPPASPVLLLFALVPVALADRRSTRAVFYAASVFLVWAAAGRFAPEQVASLPALQTASDVFLSVSLLALATAPAFLVASAGPLLLSTYCVLCLMAWYVLTHRLDRFLDPISPMVALLGGIGLAALPQPWPRRVARGLLAGGLAYVLATTLLIHGPLMWVGLSDSPQAFLRKVNEGATYSQAAMEAINRLPAEAQVLFVGEARTFYCERRARAASVFDRHPIERILETGPPGDPARRVRDALRALGVTHLYVNWPELARLAGSYGYRYQGEQRPGLPLDAYVNLIAAMTREHYITSVGVFGSDRQGNPRPDFVLYALQ